MTTLILRARGSRRPKTYELGIESEVLEMRPAIRVRTLGLIKVRTTTLNQNGEVVQVSVGNLLVQYRPK